jgi:hypothetical protein
MEKWPFTSGNFRFSELRKPLPVPSSLIMATVTPHERSKHAFFICLHLMMMKYLSCGGGERDGGGGGGELGQSGAGACVEVLGS